ncbi:MAG: DUF3795 domain-containing protein [Clostridia bacterium]|nr:DUF3795 domain-containing protein [Clostridia bacterium]
MEKNIAACGNDCGACPRHLPKTEAELNRTAELWMKTGYRDRIVSSEEISCTGCSPDNWCRYHVNRCVSAKQISDCGKCGLYPCAVIEECFAVTQSFAPSCRTACSPEEYDRMVKAFFEKKKNLDQSARERRD